ncbi:hypothetical protein ACFOX2_12615, partial [Corynebacterium marambiense]|uniref:hypothetical protein n=1 Tax=Corynebacterium marambiense TaxID=2765364 RepID=UPI0036183479
MIVVNVDILLLFIFIIVLVTVVTVGVYITAKWRLKNLENLVLGGAFKFGAGNSCISPVHY